MQRLDDTFMNIGMPSAGRKWFDGYHSYYVYLKGTDILFCRTINHSHGSKDAVVARCQFDLNDPLVVEQIRERLEAARLYVPIEPADINLRETLDGRNP